MFPGPHAVVENKKVTSLRAESAVFVNLLCFLTEFLLDSMNRVMPHDVIVCCTETAEAMRKARETNGQICG